jgi:hypothetical protein
VLDSLESDGVRSFLFQGISMSADIKPQFSAGQCDGCGTERGPLIKFSMGKDFFGRSYDRLSPSFDQRPKWYCEGCSVHKTLQRDFRDIRAELDKLDGGGASELTGPDQLQRAQLRLREITTILSAHAGGSPLIDPADVSALIHRLQGRTASPSAAG